MPRIDWRVALKAMAGFAAGLVLWVFLSPLYDRLIASVAQTTIRTFEHPAVTHLSPGDDEYVTVDRSDFDPRSKRPAIAIRDLTFNVVLLAALFAISKRAFSDRNIGGFLVALTILGITHVLGAIAEVMSIYTAKLGVWSIVHYSVFTRNFWGVASHFYRLVLMYAIAFALWWVFRDSTAEGKVRRVKKNR